MDNELIDDLKLFIATTVSQQTVDIRDDVRNLDVKLSGKIDKLEEKLSDKIDNLSAYVADALDNSNETNGAQLKNHEKRIKKLEKKVVLLQAS